MNKTFVLDTNVLLHDPKSIYTFEDNTVAIILSVMGEIDDFKKAMGELGANAREIARDLDRLAKKGCLLRVYPYRQVPLTVNHVEQVDSKILSEAKHLRDNEDTNAIIVTKDVILRVMANGLQIPAENYETDRKKVEFYSGTSEFAVAPKVIDEINDNGEVICKDLKAFKNQYIHLTAENDGKRSALGRHVENGRIVLVNSSRALNIKPRNLEQKFAIEALLDPDIRLVTLQGRAGTGKTLIAVAAGIHQVIRNSEKFSRIVITRPIVPVGKGLGFLPGDVEEKMQPWMRPIYDAIDMIQEIDRKSHKTEISNGFSEDDIQIAPLSYLRGRSIPHSFMIVDEAQNLTPLEVKTLVTRCGQDTKMIFTGDIDQIDNPFLDNRSNGFSHLISKFKNHHLHAHIELVKGERSELAEAGAKML